MPGYSQTSPDNSLRHVQSVQWMKSFSHHPELLPECFAYVHSSAATVTDQLRVLMPCYAMLRCAIKAHSISDLLCFFPFYVTTHTLQFRALDHTARNCDLLYLCRRAPLEHSCLHTLLFAQIECDSVNWIQILGVMRCTTPVMN